MRGKKFDAAEKHFLKKQEIYERKIRYLENQIKELSDKNEEQKDYIDRLELTNKELREMLNQLLEYTKVSESDVKKICEEKAKAADIMNSMFKLLENKDIFGRYL